MYRPAHVLILFLFLGGAAGRRLDLTPRIPGEAAPPKNKKIGVGGLRVYTQANPSRV